MGKNNQPQSPDNGMNLDLSTLSADELRLEVETLRQKNKKLSERIETALQSGNMAWWQMELPSGKIEFDAQKAKMIGFPEDQFKTYHDFTALLHPDDFGRVMQDMRDHLEGKKDAYITEYRLQTATGGYLWLKDVGKVVEAKPAEGYMRLLGYVEFINPRKIAEEALYDSERKFRMIAENTSDGIFVTNAAGSIIYVSPSYCKQLGYSAEEELERDSNAIFQLVHPEDREMLASSIYQAIAEKKTVHKYSFRALHKNGHYIWREDHAQFLFDDKGEYVGANVVCRDITSQKETEEKALKLQHAVEHADVCIMITNADGQIEYANTYFTSLTGFAPEEYIGKRPNILKSGMHDAEFYAQMYKTLLDGDTWQGEMCNRKKDGTLFWESSVISPIVSNGKITYFVAVKTDITHTKKINNELIKAKEKAEESDRLKTAFLANMSHEIRTPMNGILGFIDMLAEEEVSAEQRLLYTNIIHKSSQRLLKTMNDLIEISKIEAGVLQTSVRTVNLNKLLDEVFHFYERRSSEKGLTLEYFTGLRDLDAAIETDEHMLHSIVNNLVDNAIKFTLKGNVSFGYRIDEGQLEIYVKDTGIGIAHDRQKAVFERFTQADIEDTKVFEGSGLGLTLARDYTRMLRGDIDLSSDPGIGTIVRVRFPYQKSSQQTPYQLDARQTFKPATPLIKPRILIVEDEESAEVYFSLILRSRCSEILFAHSGDEAVSVCRKNPQLDLVLMDIKLPGISGYDATREIRKFNKEIIIIAQTAFALTGDADKSKRAGCNAYISKPIKKDQLFDLIDRLMNEK